MGASWLFPASWRTNGAWACDPGSDLQKPRHRACFGGGVPNLFAMTTSLAKDERRSLRPLCVLNSKTKEPRRGSGTQCRRLKIKVVPTRLLGRRQRRTAKPNLKNHALRRSVLWRAARTLPSGSERLSFFGTLRARWHPLLGRRSPLGLPLLPGEGGVSWEGQLLRRVRGLCNGGEL